MRPRRRPRPERQGLDAMSEFAQEQRTPWRLWTIAAVAAVSLHVAGAALALAHLNPDDGADGLGSNVNEIGVELTSPPAEETELPPGPDADASVASPEIAEQMAEVEPTDVPPEPPKESNDPDRVVTQTLQKKPTDDDPKTEAVQTAASQESVAQEASARQRMDGAREANAATSPNLGIGKDSQRLAAQWGQQISAYFELHKRYPKTERFKAATVKLSMVINRLGHVVSVDVAGTSGDPVFDQAALDMVRRSDPVPRPPAALTDDTFTRTIDVHFKDKK